MIVGVFSLVGIIIGLAAAIKLSTIVAGYIGQAVNVSDKWLPVISFIVVFFLMVLLVRLGADLIQKAVEMAMLGWINRLGGMIFYAIIFIIVYSIFLFYAEKLGLRPLKRLLHSTTYSFVHPWGPKAIDAFGSYSLFQRYVLGIAILF